MKKQYLSKTDSNLNGASPYHGFIIPLLDITANLNSIAENDEKVILNNFTIKSSFAHDQKSQRFFIDVFIVASLTQPTMSPFVVTSQPFSNEDSLLSFWGDELAYAWLGSFKMITADVNQMTNSLIGRAYEFQTSYTPGKDLKREFFSSTEEDADPNLTMVIAAVRRFPNPGTTQSYFTLETDAWIDYQKTAMSFGRYVAGGF